MHTLLKPSPLSSSSPSLSSYHTLSPPSPCPSSPTAVEGNETVQGYHLNRDWISSISIFFTVCKCMYVLMHSAYVHNSIHMYVCMYASTTFTCCLLCSVVYSVELTVKILALGPHSFFTKAWNVWVRLEEFGVRLAEIVKQEMCYKVGLIAGSVCDLLQVWCWCGGYCNCGPFEWTRAGLHLHLPQTTEATQVRLQSFLSSSHPLYICTVQSCTYHPSHIHVHVCLGYSDEASTLPKLYTHMCIRMCLQDHCNCHTRVCLPCRLLRLKRRYRDVMNTLVVLVPQLLRCVGWVGRRSKSWVRTYVVHTYVITFS